MLVYREITQQDTKHDKCNNKHLMMNNIFETELHSITRAMKRLIRNLRRLAMVYVILHLWLIWFQWPALLLLFMIGFCNFFVVAFDCCYYQRMKCCLIARRGIFTIGMVKRVWSSMLLVEAEVVEWTSKIFLARKSLTIALVGLVLNLSPSPKGFLVIIRYNYPWISICNASRYKE